MEILGEVGIDLRMLGAQIINFLALVALLRFVLYKPLIKIFEERESKTKKLALDLADLERKGKEANEQARSTVSRSEQVAQEVLDRGRRAALQFKEERLAITEQEVDRLIEAGNMRIQSEQTAIKKELSESIAGETLHVMGILFDEMNAGPGLHAKLMGLAREELAKSLENNGLGEAGDSIAIASPFPITPKDAAFFKKLLKKQNNTNEITYTNDSSLLAGIRIKFGAGYLFDFSLAGKFKKGLHERLKV